MEKLKNLLYIYQNVKDIPNAKLVKEIGHLNETINKQEL